MNWIPTLAMRGQDHPICAVFSDIQLLSYLKEKKIMKLPFIFQITDLFVFFKRKTKLLLSPFNFSEATCFYYIISLNACVFLQSLQPSMTLMIM